MRPQAEPRHGGRDGGGERDRRPSEGLGMGWFWWVLRIVLLMQCAKRSKKLVVKDFFI